MNSLTPTQLVLIVAFVALAVVLGYILRELRRVSRVEPPDPSAGWLALQTQLDALREQVRASLEGGRAEIDRRLDATNQVVGDVRRGLGEVDRQIRTVSDAARDLRSLQELLRSPKARGGLGEFLLAELLAQVLPQAHFSLQYEFSGGERVDAVLRLGDGLVPVDAKFPLENFHGLRQAANSNDDASEKTSRRLFRADVRRHVDAIARRYILPGQGTFEFAMMYIPAEAVYQELLHQEKDDGLDLFHYALSKRVVPVSPQSFYAYLQVIVLGLRGLTIEGRAKEIMTQLGEVRGKLERFSESFDIVSRHMGNAQRQMEEAGRRLVRLDDALGRMAEGDAEDPGVEVKPDYSRDLG